VTGLLDRFYSGDRHALSRILTHVENQTETGRAALKALGQHAGRAQIVGLTGPPGAGKSTLANALVRMLRSKNRTVAVIAIDPTSPFTGGATLGDRIRMLESQDDDGVFLRSMASRGQIGGLAVSAFGAALALDAFGFDVVIIETVGAGQDEFDVARLADTVVVVQTPGMGDSIQAFKAGILEVADVLVVNKADLPGADDVVRDLTIEARQGMRDDWRTPVLPVVAANGSGVDRLIDAIARHAEHLASRSDLTRKRANRRLHHARMLAVRAFSDFVNQERNLDESTGDPVEIAEAMIRSFARANRQPDS
jgi:LAO/AO transport system kinase